MPRTVNKQQGWMPVWLPILLFCIVFALLILFVAKTGCEKVNEPEQIDNYTEGYSKNQL